MKDVSSDKHRKVLLRDGWHDTLVYPKAFVHVVGDFDARGICVVDNNQNYIVVNPDFLVSATTVADTVSCMRKAVLQERVRATGDISKPMVYGNILHALLQASLEDNDFSTENMHNHIDRILLENIESLYILQVDIPNATDYVRSKMPLFQDWAKLYLSKRPNVSAPHGIDAALASMLTPFSQKLEFQFTADPVIQSLLLTSFWMLKSTSGRRCGVSREISMPPFRL